jgi:hypothetical protein
MLRNVSVAAGVAALLLTAVPAQAVTITYDHNHDGAGVPTSAVAGAMVNNFNSGDFTTWQNGPNPVTGTVASGGGSLFVTGDLSGRYAAPFISDGPMAGTDNPTVYLSVPGTSRSGAVTLQLDETFNYFGLFWGSIDTYNSISFLLNGVTVDSFSGTDVINPNIANGNQTAPSTNTYVNFFGLATFDAVRLASTSYAFELDNIALANIGPLTSTEIPAPAALGLFGLGLVGLGYMRRRKAA